MHGVPKNLPLESFVGDWLMQISIGQNEIIFRFSEAGFIRVEGGWELTDIGGRLIDQSSEHAVRNSYKVHLLLGSPVKSFAIEAPEWFSLSFGSGFTLKVFDDSLYYESFSVEPAGSAGIYV
jgi:hypothetical protein